MRLSRRILLPLGASFSGAALLLTTMLFAADNWTNASGGLAAKILTRITSKHAMALSLRNMSSLEEDDVSQIRRALRSELRSRGVRLTNSKQASVEVQVTLSENVEGYIWVAEIRNGISREIVMLTVEPPEPAAHHPGPEPMSIRKTRIFERAEPMLDIVPLDNLPSGAANKIIVLGPDAISLYENQIDSSGWRLMQSTSLPRIRPWARDARGRLIVRRDNSYDVYLPGAKCSGTLEPVLTLDCHESAEPWPLDFGGLSGGGAYFATDRNFFEGGIQFADGRSVKVPPFFSAALLPLKSGTIWLLAGLDGRARLLDTKAAPVANFEGWGSSVTSLQTGCQDGWQVLANSAGDFNGSDAVQTYNVVNRKAEVASLPVEFAGPVTELWPLADGFAAIAISHNLKSSRYEAFRLSISCGQ